MKKVTALIATALIMTFALGLSIPIQKTPQLAVTTVVTMAPIAASQTLTNMPTAVPTETPTTTPTPNNNYVVRSGETLGEIATKYGMPYGYLAEENNISNPNLIYPGQILIIPTWPPVLEDGDGKLIVVTLSNQEVSVYQHGILLKTFIVSTGTSKHPTVTGHYNIYVKYESQTMSGEGYYLPDVPKVMYFFEDYSLHGTYWHHNFGHPMSHGCVNMYTPDAEWLFDWANIGTPVWIYY